MIEGPQPRQRRPRDPQWFSDVGSDPGTGRDERHWASSGRVSGVPRHEIADATTRHDGIDGQGQWLAQVLRGWMAYYAVPTSGSALSAFRHHMIERWHSAL